MNTAARRVKIPLVIPETESVKFWYDRLDPLTRDAGLTSEEQIRGINHTAFNTIKCGMHDIFSYGRLHHDPEKERMRIENNLQDTVRTLKLEEDRSGWKKAYEKNARNATAVNGPNGFFRGTAKNKTAVRSIPSETIPGEIKRNSGEDDSILRLAELEEGDPFIAFLFSEDRRYFWIHTTCTEGWIPVSDAGTYHSEEQWKAAMKENPGVLTPGNLLEVMFRNYGAPYKWGSGTDCSGYVRKVFEEFGILLPLNTALQPHYPARSYNLKELPDDDKLKIIRALPVGAALYMPHHTMLYLGELDGHVYVINPLYSFYDLDHRLQTPARITVNTLDLLRSDGETWLTSLTAALVPWEEQTPAAPE